MEIEKMVAFDQVYLDKKFTEKEINHSVSKYNLVQTEEFKAIMRENEEYAKAKMMQN